MNFSFFCWGRWRLLVACGRVVGGVVSLEYPIGGIGCLGAANLAQCLVRVSTTCALFRIGCSDGFSLNFRWIFVYLILECRLCILVSLVFLVALPGLWADFNWIPARDVGLS